MRNKRYFLPAGSAVAAALILAVLFITPTQHSVVNAGTIMTDLRETLHHGLRVTFEDIHGEGATVGGHFVMIFKHELRLAQLVGVEPADDLSVESVLVHADVAMDKDAAEIPGLELQAAVGLSEDDLWVYVQTDDPQPLIAKVGPIGNLFAEPLRGGVLLELGELLDGEELLGLDLSDLRRTSCAGGDEGDGLVKARATASFDSEVSTISIGGGATVSQPGESEDDDLEDLIQSFLAGTADPEQFELIASEIEQAAADVTVEEIEPGLHVLTARNFSALAGQTGDPDEAEWLPDMVLRIGYRAEVGVVWADLENIGPRNGTVRFEFIDQPTSEQRAAKQRYIEEDSTTVFNLGGLIKSIEALGGQAQPANDAK